MARHCPYCAHRSTPTRPILATWTDTPAAGVEAICRCPRCRAWWRETTPALNTAAVWVTRIG